MPYHRDRLVKILDNFRNNVPEARFNLGSWAGSEDIPFLGGQDLSCGAVACVIGWSATIPEFQALGLYLEKEKFFGNYGRIKYAPLGDDRIYSDFEAVSQFLGLRQYVAEYLFSPDRYPGEEKTAKQEVVDRITKFLNRFPNPESNPSLSSSFEE